MERFRIRFIHPDQTISVRDLAFSQTVELTKPLTRAGRDLFWDGRVSVILPDGTSIKFVGEV